MHIAADVAAYKRATGKPVLDKAREAAKIDKATELASDEFKKFIPPLFSMMMEMSRAYQHSLLDEVSEGVVPAAIDEVAELPAAAHVAVQGVEGAYQHIACRELFDDSRYRFRAHVRRRGRRCGRGVRRIWHSAA